MATADEDLAARKRRARRILTALGETYPDAHCELDFTTPLELLVATVLSAQCTDQRVNSVTPALFRRYPDAAAYAGADRLELEALIAPTGFFRQKAKTLQALGPEALRPVRGRGARPARGPGDPAGRRPQDGERRAR